MTKKIKVLHLIKSLGRGGAEKLIPETAKVHDQDTYAFYCLYFYHQENNIVDELEQAGIAVGLIPSGNLSLLFQVTKVRDFVIKHNIDIIHAHLPWAGILSRLVGGKVNVPIVYTEHNTWDRYNKVSYWGNRMTFKKQDVAIAVSNEVALSMQLNSIFDPYQRGGRLKVKVIQNGVNTEIFQRLETEDGRPKSDASGLKSEDGSPDSYREESERLSDFSGKKSKSLSPLISESLASNDEISPSFGRRNDKNGKLKLSLNIPKEAKVIGKVAVFRSQKRLWIWVDMALKILKECPEAHFLLVGDGEWRERILEQIHKSGKESNFHWVGVQKEVLPYLSIMDIYLSTSEFEGLPIAMLEAMSCEVPVVATRAGGIGEMVQHGVQGYLTEIQGYDGLVDYCVRLIQDPVLLAQFGKAARERVVLKFSMNRMVRELEEVYAGVITKRI